MIPKNLNGWLPSPFDKRDWDWEQSFGADTPRAEALPLSFSWRDKMPSPLPIQGDEPACVSHAFAAYQMFNSWQEGNKISLSPRFLYSLTGSPGYGRNFRSHTTLLRDTGDPLESSFPNQTGLSHSDYCNASLITSAMREEAKRYKIKNWTVITPTITNLQRAVSRSPIIIAVGGNNLDWRDWKNIQPGAIDWYHAILLTGWTKDGRWEIANWWKNWGDKQYGYLSKDYPIQAAYSLEDISDFPDKPLEGWVAVYWLKLERLAKGSEVTLRENLNLRNNPAGDILSIVPKDAKATIIDDRIISAKLGSRTYLWQKIQLENLKCV